MAKNRSEERRLFGRELSFMRSVIWHGYRKSVKRKNLKFRAGVIIVSTKREDSDGIDFWIKPPYRHALIPVQVTQRGIKHFKKHNTSSKALRDFIKESNKRIMAKQKLSEKSGVGFVLVRDYSSPYPSRSISWGDIKALNHGIKNRKCT